MLRAATPDDFPALLALNAESVALLSPLTPQRLAALHAEAAWHQVVVDETGVVAFLLALREGAAYDSLNYRWFAQHYPRFLYIDRVVVARRCQGAGHGRTLYDGVIAHATAAQLPWLACEYDTEPPNESSRAFHQRFGFREVGTQRVAGGAKQVSLQALKLPADAAG